MQAGMQGICKDFDAQGNLQLGVHAYAWFMITHALLLIIHTSLCNCRYATTRSQPPCDLIQNVDNAMASFEDGVTTVSFSRLRDTGDENDISLNNCVYFLYAWGGAISDISTGQIQYHGGTRFVSMSLECIPSDCPNQCM